MNLADRFAQTARRLPDKQAVFDALGVYSGLADLENENETFRERVKEARRHVRVLSLYGRKAEPAPTLAQHPSPAPTTTGMPAVPRVLPSVP